MVVSTRCLCGHCSFLQQNVKCKEALVRTGCGSEAGVFAFYVAKMFRRKKLDKMQMDEMPCPVSMDVEYDGESTSSTQ